MWRFRHRPRWQLISLPLTYFEVEDIRPDESQGQAGSVPIFVSGELSVPKELNQGILQFLTGRDLLRFAKVSKAAEHVARRCRALLFDAIRQRIDDFAGPSGRQVNSHGFKKNNHVRVRRSGNGDQVDGYCVRVMPKYVYYVRSRDVFRRNPNIERVKSKCGVAHVCPYIGKIVEVVQNWCVESRQG